MATTTVVTTDSSQTPSSQRIEAGSFNVPIARFPQPSDNVPADANAVAAAFVKQFNTALGKGDATGLSSLFLKEESYWRDHLAASWNLRTLKGPEAIATFLNDSKNNHGTFRLKSIDLDTSSGLRSPSVAGIDPAGKVKGVQSFLNVTTEVGSGRGFMRLAYEEGSWKVFTLYTSLRELKGREENVLSRRPNGVEHGPKKDPKTWLERREEQSNFESSEPSVLILGAGQGGLTAAARLKTLGVESLLVDKEDRVGDNWRNRYRQLVLHDPVWFDHMPYIQFPPNWPVFTPKDKLGDFFEAYVKFMELNVWVKTTIVNSVWDEKERRWNVTLKRQVGDKSELRAVKPRHIIQATGHSGKKNFPDMKGMSNFAGDRLCHSSEFPGADPAGTGKSAVVVGSCNSGHDIAQDFYDKGYNVTMVQRSTTCVVSSEAIQDVGLAGLYDETGPPVDDADILLHGMPIAMFKGVQAAVAEKQSQYDSKTLQGLEKAGFRVDRGPDDTGLFPKYFQRGGGYYIDVGASQLIADGKIKIKQGQEIDEVLPHGLRFRDGTELQADEIVFATGYQNMRSETRAIFGDEVADRVNNIWGFDQEGEMRSIWRKSGHPGFWYMGGNLALCRYFSIPLALQITAIEMGLCKYEDS